MSYFDNSPGLVDDLSPAPPAAAQPAAAPAAAAVDPGAAQDRAAELEALARQADGLPYGSEVRTHIARGVESLGGDAAAGAAAAEEWEATFRAHGIAQPDVLQLIEVGLAVERGGPPSEDVEQQWLREIPERLCQEFGSPEAAERAADLAAAYVGRDPQLLAWLEETRLGSHPRVVLAIAKAAHNARRAGKF